MPDATPDARWSPARRLTQPRLWSQDCWNDDTVRQFTQVNVFSSDFLYGNPVAVVHQADDLSTETMQAFARWTNLSETTFLLAPTSDAADYRLRIFTPTGELPFAGHPTLGSAKAWLEEGGTSKQEGLIVQECGAGLVQIRKGDSRLAFAAPPLVRTGPVDAADLGQITDALGLARSAVVDSQWVDNGPGWVAVLLESAEEVLALEPDQAGFGRFTSVGAVGPYPVGSACAFEVRAFIPGIGVGEDPVTGSLNASIAEWLIREGRAPASYVASQGTRLGRQGRIHIEQSEDQLWVGGETIVGVSGQVQL
jgi:PhzF family phenazine biosynthesis protein